MTRIKKIKNVWHFDDYFNFLQTNKTNIPIGIQDFVLDPKRYLFNAKETLHDSVLIKLKLQLNIKNGKDELIINFLGPYQDKVYSFVFMDISNIQIKGKDKRFKKNDLLVHQFLIKSENSYLYEFIFVDGHKITIHFKKLQILEVSK